jgi:class 3 adenylate cyclase/tetratricopeptide (TPR) repeat protein
MSRDASCESCGRDNPQGFRFCGGCGEPLARRDRPGPDEERKVVSALFCDVARSTERAERVDPEDVRRVLAPYYRRVRGELVRFGGTVEKFIGDAVCGVFGAPRAHADDPERAVRAALAAQKTIADLNDADPELDLHVRLGVATGEALVALNPRSSEGMAWGDVMNTASRLQSAAPVDAILVDEATYLATRGAIGYDLVEPIKARGKAEPIVAWRALAPLARRGTDLSEVDEPLVGRADELSALVDALDRVCRQQRPELVTLVGEPGIGKSRLVLELFRRVELSPALIWWRQARSSPYGDGFTYWALGEIVKAHAGIRETDGSSVASEKLRRAVRHVVTDPADAQRVEANLRSLVGIGEMAPPPGDHRHAAFAAWRRFLEALADRRPLVLVFEDIHWADSGLLDFIEHIIDWAQDAPILVVCTARPELTEVRPTWGAARTNAATHSLAPLSTEEIRELVAGIGGGSVRPDGREAVVETAAGNPLFAVEFARVLVDSPEYRPSTESVHAVIASRLDALPADQKVLLQDAAVVGRIVWPGALAQIGGRPRRLAQELLDVLVQNQFLSRESSTSLVEGEPEFRFRHPLVRDVAYEQIPRLRRSEIHRRTAVWLESLSPDRVADRAEMVAYHFLSAHEYALATRSDTAELVEGARLALRDAGDRALSLNAFAAAERHFARAVDLWPAQDPELPSLLLRLGTARYYGDNGGADVLAQAEELLRAAGDPEAAAGAAILLANLAQLKAEPNERFFEHARRAVALVESRDPSRTRIEVCLDLAVLLTLAAEQEEAIAFARDALSDAESLGLIELQARALAIIGATRGLSGDPDGRADLERSIAIVEEIDSPLGSHHCGMLADLECNLGNLVRAFELQARARTHAERFGHLAHVQWMNAELVAESYWRGQWNAALELADGFLSEIGVSGGHFMEGYCRDVRARIRLARDDVGGALAESDKALECARASNQPQMLCPALAVRARVLAADDRHGDAADAVDELLGLWDEKLNLVPASSWIVDLACALERLGRTDELQPRADRVQLQTAWLEAALAFTSGAFESAADVFAAIGSQPDEALARLRAAQTTDPGECDNAELARAVAFYREVDAIAFLREATGIPMGRT